MHEIDEKLNIPGMPNVLWMPIQTRTEMLSTGVRSPLAIEVYGDKRDDLEAAGLEIEKVLHQVPGTRSAFAERQTGGFYVDVVARRADAARFGLTVDDINEVVETAIGGVAVSQTVEGRERYPINVRYARELRDDPESLGRILVATPTGAQVPLSQVADIQTVTGPPMIRSEDGKLAGLVLVDTDRPIVDYVHDAQEILARNAKLPAGVRPVWVGQYQANERANAKMWIVVPITLGIVALLLLINTRSVVETFIILAAVPFSLVGAVWLLYLLDYNVSQAVKVGLIALAGLVLVDTDRPIVDYVHDAEDVIAHKAKLPAGARHVWVGQYQANERADAKMWIVVPITLAIVALLLLINTRSIAETLIILAAVPFSLVGAIWLLYLTLAHRRWKEEGRLHTQDDLREAIVDGAARRIRPKLMTVLTMMIGLIPVLWSTGTGADVMKRIAAPMVGGLATSFLLELTVYPAIFAIWKGRGLPSGAPVATAKEIES